MRGAFPLVATMLRNSTIIIIFRDIIIVEYSQLKAFTYHIIELSEYYETINKMVGTIKKKKKNNNIYFYMKN